MSVDLSGARATLEGFMSDPRTGSNVTVSRDSEAEMDDTLDRATGALVPPAGDDDGVWTGPGLISPVSGSDEDAELTAGLDREDAAYVLKIPFSAPEIRRGDRVLVNSAADPLLVGSTFVITRVIRKTIQVARKAVLRVDE